VLAQPWGARIVIVEDLDQRMQSAPGRGLTIVLLTGSSLCHNPRALKEATALARAGYRVQVLGAWLDAGLRARDEALLPGLPFEFVPVVDTTGGGAGDRLVHFGRRAGRKAAQLAHDIAGWQSRHQLGMTVAPLLREARRRPADLYIAHSEAGLCVAGALSRQRRRVGVDMEDWFSEDLLPGARRHRPLRLLQTLEREVLRGGAWASCPSWAMATALADAYGCRRPSVIYNAFPWSDRFSLGGVTIDRRDRSVPSIHWFSQTLGPGRGIECLLAALPMIRDTCEIHLRGRPAPGFAGWIAEQLPERWRDRVFLHGLIDDAELLPRIAEHDIGFAGEEPYCRSRDLTVTNKILHYLLGGLAVVASDTEGQREVARQAPEAVALYRAGDASGLASRLDALIQSASRREAMQRAAWAAARAVFCWEREEEKLLSAVTGALDGVARSNIAYPP
jgi:glycosyltransferase involved in cell wall biosynthesis